jgi:phosphohistidine swiveling domain-containing protein
MSPSRFLATIAKDAGAADVERSLSQLAAAGPIGPLPPPQDRISFLILRARTRSRGGTVLVQTLDPGARFGHLVTRDLRTGQGPPRGQLDASPRALVEPIGSLAPLAEIAELSAKDRGVLEELAAAVEADLKQPARIAFELGSQGPKLVAVTPLRHSGRAALALAVALFESGRLDAAAALQAVRPADVLSSLEVHLHPEPAQIVGRGVAAGGGVAVGHAFFSPGRAAAYALAGPGAPILIVEELVAEDSPVLALSRGVVTVRGGITGEAAIMARALAIPCVASGPSLTLAGGAAVSASGIRIEEGDAVAIDGSTGMIVRGACRRTCDVPADVHAVLAWTKGTPLPLIAGVVESEHDARLALALGADALAVLAAEGVAKEDADRARIVASIVGMAGTRPVFVTPNAAFPGLAGLTVLGSRGAPVLWAGRNTDPEPDEPFLAWTAAPADGRVVASVVKGEGCGLACPPEQVPAARVALARASQSPVG